MKGNHSPKVCAYTVVGNGGLKTLCYYNTICAVPPAFLFWKFELANEDSTQKRYKTGNSM